MRKISNAELNRLSVEEFKQQAKTPISIILDDIRSLNNIGSVFRTSDAFRIKKIYLCGITARPPHRDIQKTALGATETVDWEYRENVLDLIKELQSDQVKVFAIEQADESLSLDKFIPQGEIAIILGNEVKGVSQEAVTQADNCIEVPQYGTKHSLNISVCTGVVVWDLFQKMKS